MSDLIDRQAAIDIASGYCHHSNIAKELAKLPSAEPERNTGKWIDCIDEKTCKWWNRFKCSACGVQSFMSPYCPYCGADMREEE